MTRSNLLLIIHTHLAAMMCIGASYVPGNVSNQPNDTKQLYVNDYSRKDNIAAYDGV